MTKDWIENRLKDLQQQLKQLEANYNTVLGALKMLEEIAQQTEDGGADKSAPSLPLE